MEATFGPSRTHWPSRLSLLHSSFKRNGTKDIRQFHVLTLRDIRSVTCDLGLRPHPAMDMRSVTSMMWHMGINDPWFAAFGASFFRGPAASWAALASPYERLASTPGGKETRCLRGRQPLSAVALAGVRTPEPRPPGSAL